jgi:prepilin peptidase CpaA
MPITGPALLHLILLLTAATALLFAVVHDVAVRTVPNRVSLVVATTGLALSVLDGQLVQALFGGGLVFAGCWYCWRHGWIGGGDVKLLSACTLLVPPAAVPELVLATAIAGGVLAVLYLALGAALKAALAWRLPGGTAPRPTGLLKRIWRAEGRRIRRRLSLPYACAIAAGVLLTLYHPFAIA